MSVHINQKSSNESSPDLLFDKLAIVNEFVLPENLSLPLSGESAVKFTEQGLTGKQALCAILRISAKHFGRNINNLFLNAFEQENIIGEIMADANNEVRNQINQLQEQINTLQRKLQAGNFPNNFQMSGQSPQINHDVSGQMHSQPQYGTAPYGAFGQQPNFVPHPDTVCSQMQGPYPAQQGAGWFGAAASMAQYPMMQSQQPPWGNNMNFNQMPSSWQQNQQPMQLSPCQQLPVPLGPQYYGDNIRGQIDALALHYINNGYINSENIEAIAKAINGTVIKTTLPKDKVEMVMNSVLTLLSLTLHQFGDEKYHITPQYIYVVSK